MSLVVMIRLALPPMKANVQAKTVVVALTLLLPLLVAAMHSLQPIGAQPVTRAIRQLFASQTA